MEFGKNSVLFVVHGTSYLSKRHIYPILFLQTQEKEDWCTCNTKTRKSLPKFNSPETKQKLAEFATEITPECGIPVVYLV